jgi:hypothetical protein
MNNFLEKNGQLSISLPIDLDLNKSDMKKMIKIKAIKKALDSSQNYYLNFIEKYIKESSLNIDRIINFKYLDYLDYEKSLILSSDCLELIEDKGNFLIFKIKENFNLDNFYKETQESLNEWIVKNNLLLDQKIISIEYNFEKNNKTSSIEIYMNSNYKLKVSISNSDRIISEKNMKKVLNRFYILTETVNEENKKLDYNKPYFKVFYSQKSNIFELADKIIKSSILDK